MLSFTIPYPEVNVNSVYYGAMLSDPYFSMSCRRFRKETGGYYVQDLQMADGTVSDWEYPVICGAYLSHHLRCLCPATVYGPEYFKGWDKDGIEQYSDRMKYACMKHSVKYCIQSIKNTYTSARFKDSRRWN